MTMAGPRLTGPATKLARTITTSAPASVPKPATGTILTSSKSTAPLSRKYADLLKERNIEWDHPRSIHMRSSNRPHPPPKTMRLMQTFTTSAPNEAQAGLTMDQTVIPHSTATEGSVGESLAQVRVPLLPDNFVTHHAPDVADGPLPTPEISVIAANPDTVSPSALTEVEGMGIDGVELGFVHETQEAPKEPGMLTDLWKGLVDDVFSSSKSGGKLAL
jgi:hypothetical protein